MLRLSVMQFAGARVPPPPCRRYGECQELLSPRRARSSGPPSGAEDREREVLWTFFLACWGRLQSSHPTGGGGWPALGLRLRVPGTRPDEIHVDTALINSEGAEGRHAHRGKGPPACARRARPPAANAQVRLTLPAADEKGCRNWLGGRPAGPRCCPDRCFTPIADTSRTPNTCLDEAHGRRRERIVARRLARLDMTRTGLHTCVCGVRAFVRACVRPG